MATRNQIDDAAINAANQAIADLPDQDCAIVVLIRATDGTHLRMVSNVVGNRPAIKRILNEAISGLDKPGLVVDAHQPVKRIIVPS
jgi:hypothetical protein